jgi:maltose/moltooligosaccharide transporter
MRQRSEQSGILAWFKEIFSAVAAMPATMKQLAVVQLFTWLGLFCMWIFFGLATAQQVFKTTNPDTLAFKEGIEWGGFAFAMYNVVCFAIAFLLPKLAAMTSRKTVHALSLICGGLGLLSAYFIEDKNLWLLTMLGVGIAWASILSMPYAILSGALPPARMGVYMGIFNFFIVIPEIIASLTFQPLVKHVFHNNPLYVVMLGGVCLLIAAALVAIVRDVSDRVPVEAVIGADEHEPLTIPVTAQPVPSTGLIDEE